MKKAYESEENLKPFHYYHEGYYDYGDTKIHSQTWREFSKGLALVERVAGSVDSPSIFDVGFGNGFFLAVAQERGWNVSGIDSSAKNVQLAKTKFGLELEQNEFERFEPGQERFDAVSFWDVIEHLPAPHAAIQKAGRMLKPGGVLLIGVPNDTNLLALLVRLSRFFTFGKLAYGLDKLYFLEHVCYYNTNTLTFLLQRNGFERHGHFFSSTDLKKYSLRAWDRFLAPGVLLLGKWTGLQNRVVAVFRKSSQ